METQLSNLPRKENLTGFEILPALDTETGEPIQIRINDISANVDIDIGAVANAVANNISGTIQIAIDAANSASYSANIAAGAANSANGFAFAAANSATTAAAFANDSFQYSIVSEESSLVSRIVAGNLFPFDFKEESRYWSTSFNSADQFDNPITGSFPIASGKGKVFQKTPTRASISYTIYSTGSETLIPTRTTKVACSYRYIGGDGTYDVKAKIVGLNAAGDAIVYSEETLVSGNTNDSTWKDIVLEIDTDSFISGGAVAIRPALQLFVNSGTVDPTFQVHFIKFNDTTESSLSSDFLEATITARNQAETFANSSFQSANTSSTFAQQAQLFRDQANTSAIAAFNSQVTANTHANTAGTFASASESSSLAAAVSANTASTQAGIASSAAVSANNSASAASTSQTLSASFATDSKKTAASLLPHDFSQDGKFWSSGPNYFYGAPYQNFPEPTNDTVQSFVTTSEGRILRIISQDPFWDVASRGSVKYITGRRYKATARVGHTGGTGPASYGLFIAYLDSNHDFISASSVSFSANGTYANQELLSEVTPPGGTVYIRPFLRLFYVAGTTSDVVSIKFEDITESLSANSSAFIATTQATNASASAASASQSAVLSATIGLNSLNKNPTFADWPTGNLYPTNWAEWSLGSSVTRVTGDLGGYAYQHTTDASSNYGILSTPDGMLNKKAAGWYVIEGDVTLVSGSLQGAGMYLAQNGILAQVLDFFVEAGAGTAGRRYKFAKLVQYTENTITDWTLIAMSQWTGFGVGTAVKTIKWHRCSVRDATPAEIRDQTVLAPMQTTVATHTSQISALVTADAAAVTSITNLTASFESSRATNSLVVNPNFGNYANPTGVPYGWVNYNLSDITYRVAGPNGTGYGIAWDASPGETRGIFASVGSLNPQLGKIRQGYFVAECDMEIRIGRLNAMLVYVQALDSGGSEVASQTIVLQTDINNQTGAALGEGDAGKFYSFKKLMYFTHPNINNYRIYFFHGGEDSGQGKHPTIYKLSLRPATPEEIRRMTVLDPTVSTVATHSSQISALTTADAATASSITSLTASVNNSMSRSYLNRNPNFSDWPDGTHLPNRWALASGPNGSRETGKIGRYTLRQSVTAGQNGFYAITGSNGFDGYGIDEGLSLGTAGWYVLTSEFTLVSGTLVGAGHYASWFNVGLGAISAVSDSFVTTPDVNGVVHGNGVVGRTYRFSRLFQITDTTSAVLRCHPMTGWDGFGTIAAKTIDWHEFGIRRATETEVRDRTVLAPLQATVSTHSSAIAEASGRSQAAWGVNVNAGAAGSFISAVAQTRYASPVEIVWNRTDFSGYDYFTFYGPDIVRTSGPVNWGYGIRSSNSITGDLTVSCQVLPTSDNINSFIGFSIDTGEIYYPSVEFSIHISGDGNIFAYEGGVPTSLGINVLTVTGQRISVERDGSTVRYRINNRILRTVTGVSTNAAFLYLETYSPSSSRFKNVFWGSGLNVYSSNISLGAEEVHILNSVDGTYKKALSIVGGNATFSGELNVGTGSGARVNITQNLIRVYDANNVMRVRLGVW
jgi:hypothetical protein